MNAVEKFKSTADNFDELAYLTEKMVAKFERTEDMLARPEMVENREPNNSQPDLIDLFNGINNRLELVLNKIGSNVEKIINMID